MDQLLSEISNLKHYAAGTEGITNGAMLFDTHKIQPLFKLQIGQAGSSFAFEIARKMANDCNQSCCHTQQQQQHMNI